MRENKTIEWVDVYDDDLMVSLGIRYPQLNERDREVWTKSSQEKQLLKKLRRRFKGNMHFHSKPKRSIPVRATLIIRLKPNKQFAKSTYSIICWQHEIRNILSQYIVRHNTGLSENLVVNYSYNNKTYHVNQLPFWYW
jgi:hypothetical protein